MTRALRPAGGAADLASALPVLRADRAAARASAPVPVAGGARAGKARRSPRAKAARARRAADAARLPRVELLFVSSAAAHIRLNDLPIASEANARESRFEVTDRKQAQRERVKEAFKALREAARVWPVAPPKSVLFVRLGPKELDDDNLAGAFKAVRDQVAKEFGVTDAPGGPVKWVPAQRKHSGPVGCELLIEW